MQETLLFRIPELRRPGLPVRYVNNLVAPDGHGVIVEAPDGREDKLVFWEGTRANPLPDNPFGSARDAFQQLIGNPPLGSDQVARFFDAPWCVEIDLDHPDGKAAARMWLGLLDDEMEMSPEALFDAMWARSSSPCDENDEYYTEGTRPKLFQSA